MKRHTLATVGLVGALAAAGCTPSFDCGGDPTGTWVLTDATTTCTRFEVDIDYSESPTSCAIRRDDVSLALQFVRTYPNDSTLGSVTMTGFVDGVYRIDTIAAGAIDAAPLVDCYSWSVLEATACALTPDGCACSFSDYRSINYWMNYRTAGGQIIWGGRFFIPSPLDPGETDDANHTTSYCVDGDTLRIASGRFPHKTYTYSRVAAAPDVGGIDLAAPVDMAAPASSDGGSAATVPCVGDRDCPSGEVCTGARSPNVCVPGCRIDWPEGCPLGPNSECCESPSPVEPGIGVCTNVAHDPGNCGACGVVCPSTKATCVEGGCQ